MRRSTPSRSKGEEEKSSSLAANVAAEMAHFFRNCSQLYHIWWDLMEIDRDL